MRVCVRENSNEKEAERGGALDLSRFTHNKYELRFENCSLSVGLLVRVRVCVCRVRERERKPHTVKTPSQDSGAKENRVTVTFFLTHSHLPFSLSLSHSHLLLSFSLTHTCHSLPLFLCLLFLCFSSLNLTQKEGLRAVFGRNDLYLCGLMHTHTGGTQHIVSTRQCLRRARAPTRNCLLLLVSPITWFSPPRLVGWMRE